MGPVLLPGGPLRARLAPLAPVTVAQATRHPGSGQLDPDSEAEVLAALDALAAGRTVLTVTHRAALLALHDRVVTIEDGAVRGAAALR